MVELQPQFQAYCHRLPTMLRSGHDGQYVLIRADEPDVFFTSLDKALSYAYERFEPGSFFVKKVTEDKASAHFTRDLGPCRPY